MFGLVGMSAYHPMFAASYREFSKPALDYTSSDIEAGATRASCEVVVYTENGSDVDAIRADAFSQYTVMSHARWQ
jgi:hypothetical protein